MRFTVSTIIEITITLSNRNLESSVQNVRFCIKAEEKYVALTVKKIIMNLFMLTDNVKLTYLFCMSTQLMLRVDINRSLIMFT